MSASLANNETMARPVRKQTHAAKRRGTGIGANVRLAVQKTYKLYIAGRFERSESGRYIKTNGHAVVCRSSRKDFRNAVTAARKAFPGWAGRTAYLRGQILYRIAETLESREDQFTGLLVDTGMPRTRARTDFCRAVDTLVYYAGWCDKYMQVFSTVNPVSGRYFSFSYPEPMGVVAILAPERAGLSALVSLFAPALAGGNSVVLLSDPVSGPVATNLAEVIHASDVPAGAINLLTGHYDELAQALATHMDVNATVCVGGDASLRKTVESEAARNVKRVVLHDPEKDPPVHDPDPYRIMALQEIKTTWHPVGY